MIQLKRLFVSFLSGILLVGTAVPAYAHQGQAPRGLHLGLGLGLGGKAKVAMAKNHEVENNNDNDDDNEKEEKMKIGLRSLVAFIAKIDTETNTIFIRKNGTQRVSAKNALIVKVGPNGAKTGTLADLKTNTKAYFLVKKQRLEKDFFDAVLIMQFDGTVISPPPPPTLPEVKFSANSGSGDESVAAVNISVSLSKTSDKDVKFHYTVSGGMATGGGTDYTLANGELTIPAGQTSANIAMTVTNDDAAENDETVMVKLSDPTNAALGSSADFTYTIKDNDQPKVQFSAEASSGLESVTPVNLPVTLSKSSEEEVKVKYSVTGGTGIGGGVDFTLMGSGELTFAPGETGKNIVLTVVDDVLDESDETVKVTLSEESNASLGTTTHTYTVLDND